MAMEILPQDASNWQNWGVCIELVGEAFPDSSPVRKGCGKKRVFVGGGSAAHKNPFLLPAKSAP